jgi:GntR family transcriptional regulator, histidine utilization repressor
VNKPVAFSEPVQTLHRRILNDIEHEILSGNWPPGHRLPFEVLLAKSYGVSRMTVNKVLTKLVDQGLIERRRKSGSFVTQPQAQSAILEIHDIEAEVRSLGQSYAYELVARQCRRSNNNDRSLFAEKKSFDVLTVKCLHFAAGLPFCFEDRLINLNVVPNAAAADFARVIPGQWLLLQVPWTAAEHKIHAVAAKTYEAKKLSIAKGEPCLVVQRRTWNASGSVTHAKFIYPSTKHAVIARFQPAGSS